MWKSHLVGFHFSKTRSHQLQPSALLPSPAQLFPCPLLSQCQCWAGRCCVYLLSEQLSRLVGTDRWLLWDISKRGKKQEPLNPLQVPCSVCIGKAMCLNQPGKANEVKGRVRLKEVSNQSPQVKFLCNLSFHSLPQLLSCCPIYEGSRPKQMRIRKALGIFLGISVSLSDVAFRFLNSSFSIWLKGVSMP